MIQNIQPSVLIGASMQGRFNINWRRETLHMADRINQAVVFTKPVHHLGLSLTPGQLDGELRAFLEDKGFGIVLSRKMTGPMLAERDVLKKHYLMYSRASCIGSAEELEVSGEAAAGFESAFGKPWRDEVVAGKIMGNPRLMEKKKITAPELYLRWNERFENHQTVKIQEGLVMAWLDELDCYCINAFYPILEEIFYAPATEIHYHVVEFDPGQVSWARFREKILGATDASHADPGSFRGRLYAAYGDVLEYPGRDNFVHGSAGPLEGFIERAVHEPDFDMATNPVGQYMLERGISLEVFKHWKSRQSIPQLGELFCATEEKDTADALSELAGIHF